MHIFLVYGGRTAEHEVSVNSAASFLRGVSFDHHSVTLVYITREGDWLKGPHLREPAEFEEDKELELGESETFNSLPMTFEELKTENSIVFPLMHGTYGEDGTVQGLLELLDVPYAGPGVMPCAAGIDKILSNIIFERVEIPQPDFLAVTEREWTEEKTAVLKKCEEKLTYPIYIKPAKLGSSIGITEAKSREELEKGFDKAFLYGRRAVVEQGVRARELNVALLGNDSPKVSIVGELVKESGFLDYENKYHTSTVEKRYPADVSEEEEALLKKYALEGFKALDGNGMGRADLFLTKDGKIYLNEINMIPGFSSKSVFASLWTNSGLPYTDLIDELVELGMERYEVDRKKETNIRH